MEKTIMTSLTEADIKTLVKEALKELLGTGIIKGIQNNVPDLLDIKQAADFLRLKITTLYEKTSKRLIPHFKKGNKLYFERAKLVAWLQAGEVKTGDEINSEAGKYLHGRKRNH